VHQLAVAEPNTDILSAIRRLQGKATVGDVVAATGLATDRVNQGLKDLLESHHGHLAVSDKGELLYEFDPRLMERGRESIWTRFKRSAWSLFTRAFKAWIVMMLVVYFVVFVVLVVLALFANRDDSRGGWGGGRGRGGRRGGGLAIPDLWFWYWIWGPRWYIGRPYYGHRWERTLDKEDKVPFYKKVFAFVFGPDRPRPTQQQLDRSTLRLIRTRRGVITTADLVEHTGLPWRDAEDEMGRLVGAYAGEAMVTPGGEVAYAFPELMMSAHGHAGGRVPDPAWMRLEYPDELTGNTASANAAVAGINAFNLVAAVTAPWFIFPRLHIGGQLAWVFLVFVPVVFSLSFFAVPGLRMLAVKWENRRRLRRNVRRVLLGYVYRETLEKDRGIRLDEATRHVASLLKDVAVPAAAVEKELHRVAVELDAEVSPAADGQLVFRFPALRRQVAEGEVLRRRLALDRRDMGDIVYSTSDDSVTDSERELKAFDKELAASRGDVAQAKPAGSGSDVAGAQATEPLFAGYLPPADQIAYEDVFELVAFDEEMARRQKAQLS
jgi:hypothetical protein